MTTTLNQYLLCFFVGVIVAFVATFTVGYTMAIAAPKAMFEWLKSNDFLEAGLLLWDLTVVFGLGSGLLAFLALLAAFRFVVAPTARAALIFLSGALFAAHVLVPIAHDMPLSLLLSRPWQSYGFELSLFGGAFVALLVARQLWPNKSFEPKPLRGSA